MNTKFYKEYQDRYPTILGSDRNISYVTFLEEFVTELQNQVKLLIIGDVSNCCVNCIYLKHKPEAKYRHEENKCQICGLYINDVNFNKCQHFMKTQ